MGPSNFLKRSALLSHPQSCPVLQMISFSVERMFARLRIKKLRFGILLTNTHSEEQITKILLHLVQLYILMHFFVVFFIVYQPPKKMYITKNQTNQRTFC